MEHEPPEAPAWLYGFTDDGYLAKIPCDGRHRLIVLATGYLDAVSEPSR
jgi:hypothetical protein